MPHFSLDSWIFQSLVRKLADGFEPMDLLPPSTSGNRLILNAESIRESARRAFSDIAYVMPQDQLDSFAHIASAPNATSTERFVAQTLLDNAQEAQKGTYPICQDTGTAVIYAWKGSRIEIEDDADIERLLAEGAGLAYRKELLRNSQNGPLSMIEERNTGDNLPAGIQIREVPGDCLVLLCAAKGGGSTSRTSLTMESPAILRPERLEQVLRERIRSLGPSGCPPYTISVVLGGATPSQTLYVAELAALGILDDLPPVADGCGTPLRDRQWEASILRIAEDSGIGAQWGGTHMAAKVRAIRLARHAAALPLAVTVSCAANRHVLVVADRSGWYREPLAARFEASQTGHELIAQGAVRITTSRNSNSWLESLRALPAGTMVLLSGPVLVARDAAHARILRMVEQKGNIPEWFIGLPVFYAGPTEAKPGRRSGAVGPTTASRMDSYLVPFMEQGASLVTIAKGSRSAIARQAIRAHGGVYLAAIGGAAALTAARHIRSIETIAFPDLGMEAVRLMELDSLPVLVAIDSQGNDIYDR